MNDNVWVRTAGGSMIRPEMIVSIEVGAIVIPAPVLELRAHVRGESNRTDGNSSTRVVTLASVPFTTEEPVDPSEFVFADEGWKRDVTAQLTAHIEPLTIALATGSSAEHVVISVDPEAGVQVKRRNLWTGDEETTSVSASS